MRIVFMRMINKTQDVMPRNIINLPDITRHWCWVRHRYCLAGITKLGEQVAKNTKLEKK